MQNESLALLCHFPLMLYILDVILLMLQLCQVTRELENGDLHVQIKNTRKESTWNCHTLCVPLYLGLEVHVNTVA
jgi:hypothetical protein